MAANKVICCVTCDVDMIFPHCPGFTANQFRPKLCMHCSHAQSEHSKDAIEELLRSYSKDVKLDYTTHDDAGTASEIAIEPDPEEDYDTSDEVIVFDVLDDAPRKSGTTGDRNSRIGVSPRPQTTPTASDPSSTNKTPANKVTTTPSPSSSTASTAAPAKEPCPVCGQPTDRYTVKGFALPCSACPKPATPPPRRRVGGVAAPTSGASRAGIPSFKKPGTTIRPPAPTTRMVPPTAVTEPEKPLVKVPKGFTCEWGSTQPDAKNQIVDDDRYSPFYGHYFANGKRKHSIYFGLMPESDDPVVLAVEAPREEDSDMPADSALRGLLFTCKPLSKKDEDRWVFIKSDVPIKEQLKDLKPALAGVKWSQVADEAAFSDSLFQYEKKILSNTDRFKFGLLYVKADQTGDENAMFSNTEGSEEFHHFMSVLGEKVPLKGWDKYAGGLNVKDDTTGTHSVYTMIRGFQIMFHVSIFLPHREGDEQRLDKKRHLGNDVVVVVFCDSEDVRFDPLEIHSQFNHVFVVVVPQPRAPNGKRQYRIAVVRKPGVPAIQPSLKHPAIYEEGDNFREMFLTKLINGERLSMYAPDFVRKMYRTRKELLNLTIKGVKTAKKDGLFKKLENSLGRGLDRMKSQSRDDIGSRRSDDNNISSGGASSSSGSGTPSSAPSVTMSSSVDDRSSGAASTEAMPRSSSLAERGSKHRRNLSLGKMVGNLKKKSDAKTDSNSMVISSPVLTGDSGRLSQSRATGGDVRPPVDSGGSGSGTPSSRSSQTLKEARLSRSDVDE